MNTGRKLFISILTVFLLPQCTDEDVSPIVPGAVKRESHYHSSNLTAPQFTLVHHYNDKDQRIKTQKYGATFELIHNFYYNYDDNGNLIRTVRFEASADGTEIITEHLHSFNDDNQKFRSAHYLNGDLIFLQTTTYTEFGEIENVQEISYDLGNLAERQIRYDSMKRAVTEINKFNNVISSLSHYQYFGDGLDREFRTYAGEDSVLWLQGKENYDKNNIVFKETFNHIDGNTFLDKYFYNDLDNLERETYAKNGEERVRIANTFAGPLLIEHRRYNVDFNQTSDDYILTVYEYF